MPPPVYRPRRRSTRFHRIMSGASAGCTAFLLGALGLGILLFALDLRGN